MEKEKQQRYIEFARYFSKICKNEELFNWGLEYFSFLQNINFNLTKKNLDKLEFNGKIYEQDIIKELFKNRNEVPIDEVFFYQMKKIVKNIELIDSIKNEKEFNNLVVLGRVDNEKKSIMITDFHYQTKMLKNCFYPTKDMPRYIISKELKKDFNKTSKKMTFFHELSHILQDKYYNNSQYCEIGISNYFKDIINNKFYSNDICKDVNLVEYYTHGKSFLNEIFNQYFTGSISNFSIIKNNKTSLNNILQKRTEEKNTYLFKEKNYLHLFNAYYSELGMVLPFFTSLLNEVNLFDFNLKSRQIEKIINSYEPSLPIKEKTSKYLADVFSNLTLILKNKNNPEEKTSIDLKQLTKGYEKEISKFNNFEKICLLVFARYNPTNEQIFYNNKNFFEGYALNLYRNKISQEFENEKVEKDGKYFEKINQNLIQIDKFIYGEWDEKVECRDLKTGEKKTASLEEVGSIENLVQLYPEYIHFQEFNFLLADLEKYIKTLPKNEQKVAFSTLTFLTKQKELNEKYFVIQNENIENNKNLTNSKTTCEDLQK